MLAYFKLGCVWVWAEKKQPGVGEKATERREGFPSSKQTGVSFFKIKSLKYIDCFFP